MRGRIKKRRALHKLSLIERAARILGLGSSRVILVSSLPYVVGARCKARKL
jgi:hypothetical protein